MNLNFSANMAGFCRDSHIFLFEFLLLAYHKNHETTLGYEMHSNKNIIQSNDKYPQFQKQSE